MINLYSSSQRLLHHLILSNKLIKKSLFEIEKIFFLEENYIETKNKEHIFISGLPRSGTTILLDYFFSSKKYASLTYKDMPFVTSPNLFKTLKKFTPSKKSLKTFERMHGDKLKINQNSPEALDEVFFSVLTENNLKNELLKFVSLVTKKEKKITYLSKNNYNFKRLNLLRSVFPNCFILIPFRNPFDHANSLLNQHKNFLGLHKKDKFILDYMNYLGHKEFGQNHLPWFKPSKTFEPLNINYWLEQWIIFYQNILTRISGKKNCILIPYNQLNNKKLICSMNKRFNLVKMEKKSFFKISEYKLSSNISSNLMKTASGLFTNLNNFSNCLK